MGLDIYLYRYDNFDNSQELEKKYQELTNKNWGENSKDEYYDNLTDEEKDNFIKKDLEISESLGLDRWGSHIEGREKIEINSKNYPEHYFKIGYFRSSYNEGGIQRILKNFDLPTLKDVFNVDDNQYYVKPDWENSLINIRSLIEKFKTVGNYRVHHVASNMFLNEPSPIKTEKDALNLFLEEIKKCVGTEKYNYSNVNGDFTHAEPIKVLALIPGTYKIFNDRECVYVISESDNTWYLNALEIVKETIEYVLQQKNIDQYYLHWSG